MKKMILSLALFATLSGYAQTNQDTLKALRLEKKQNSLLIKELKKANKETNDSIQLIKLRATVTKQRLTITKLKTK